MTKTQLAALLALLQSLVPEEEPPPKPTDALDSSNRPGGALPIPYTGPVVAVRPTGVRANGIVREWPVPLAGLNWFGYMQWCCALLRPDGLSYVPAQYRAQLGTILLGGGPTKPADFPWHADCFSYPEDWQTQAQIDQHEKDVAGWTDWNNRMQNRNDETSSGGSI